MLTRANLRSANPYCRISDATFDHDMSGSFLDITFTSEDFDPWNMHDTVSNTQNIVIPVTGIYVINLNVLWPTNATGVRIITIDIAGANVASTRHNAASAFLTAQICTQIAQIDSGVIVNATGFQDSGGTLSNLTSNMSVVRVSG